MRLLDEDIVRQEFRGYPGHAEAARRWEAAVDGGARAGERKAIYEREFRLPMQVESYAMIGRALAAAGRKPQALKDIVDDAVRAARGAPVQHGITGSPNGSG